jgi:hypothetical protein
MISVAELISSRARHKQLCRLTTVDLREFQNNGGELAANFIHNFRGLEYGASNKVYGLPALLPHNTGRS